MLCKLSIRNLRRSLRDFAVYFMTLVIGVSVFYVFNAIGGQAATLRLTQSQHEVIQLLDTVMSGTSVFVAGVLGLLIVYASRFLMKRRSKEFALYMLLGMGKGKISAILLIETILIGIGSLAVGLILGIGLSQLMSALVVNLFEADMKAYHFTVSGAAIVKTILYFAVMYLVVMVFNSVVITKMKLIDLIQTGRRSEQIRLKSPVLCVIVFLLAAGMLAFAYHQVSWQNVSLSRNEMLVYIAMGTAATFGIFWSVSGMLLRVMMSMKNVYHRGLNVFTIRQISSKINTMVFSMTIICLMLFVTICTLTSAFSIRNSMNANLQELCPADFLLAVDLTGSPDGSKPLTITERCDPTADAADYVDLCVYSDPAFTFADAFGDALAVLQEQYPFLQSEMPEQFVRVSDYNRLMRLYGGEMLTVNDGDFILLCDFKTMQTVRDMALQHGTEIHAFGQTLRPQYDCCKHGFIEMAAEHINIGLYVVQDAVLDGAAPVTEYFIGNFAGEDTEAAEARLHDLAAAADISGIQTRSEIYAAAIGLGAVVTFLGLYVGLVFLIACGAILALKELSESTDSAGRYELLRKLGADEKSLSQSLFRQTGSFFLLPLVLAALHSVFGMQYSVHFMEVFGMEHIVDSITATSIILLAVYGGYFLATYLCSKGIIRERR